MSNISKSRYFGWAWTLWLVLSLVALGVNPLNWHFWVVAFPVVILVKYEVRYQIKAIKEDSVNDGFLI
jgi:hypothetical protein